MTSQPRYSGPPQSQQGPADADKGSIGHLSGPPPGASATPSAASPPQAAPAQAGSPPGTAAPASSAAPAGASPAPAGAPPSAGADAKPEQQNLRKPPRGTIDGFSLWVVTKLAIAKMS